MKKTEIRKLIREALKEQKGSAGPRPDFNKSNQDPTPDELQQLKRQIDGLIQNVGESRKWKWRIGLKPLRFKVWYDFDHTPDAPTDPWA